MGEAYAGQGNPVLAQQCYRNALRMIRGEPVEALPGSVHEAHEGSTHIDPERRNEHGVPQLPDDDASA
jgi:HemY protein